MRFYVSFGQGHTHRIDGLTYDADSLMLVEAPGELVARLGINKLTERRWSSLYQEEELPSVLHYFPRGVINAHKPVEVFIGEHGEPRCADSECWNDTEE